MPKRFGSSWFACLLLAGLPLAALTPGAPEAPQDNLPVREIASVPRLEGLWEGVILYDPAQVELETTAEIARDAQGNLVGTIDLPTHQMKFHPLRDFRLDGRKAAFTFYRSSERRGPNSPFTFEGEISPDGRVLEGMFTGFYNEEKGIDRVPFRFERIGEPGDERPEIVQPALLTLSPAGGELREAFNRDAGSIRLVMLLSPT
ncbi:MAG TPA: hypothetical protein VE078_14620 [Thermoanaerobaculia bacterium]|nr:hypothetical protein [Thermoanaerobaculia bacterium]